MDVPTYVCNILTLQGFKRLKRPSRSLKVIANGAHAFQRVSHYNFGPLKSEQWLLGCSVTTNDIRHMTYRQRNVPYLVLQDERMREVGNFLRVLCVPFVALTLLV